MDSGNVDLEKGISCEGWWLKDIGVYVIAGQLFGKRLILGFENGLGAFGANEAALIMFATLMCP